MTAPPSTTRKSELLGDLRLLFDTMRSLEHDQTANLLSQRLKTLFKQLHPLLEPGRPPVVTPLNNVDVARVRKLLELLAAPLEHARRDGSLADVWAIATIRRNEIRNAAVLAALWDPRICGVIAVEFLAAFLSTFSDQQLPTRDELDAGYAIRTEDQPLGEATERVDIVIDGAAFLLGIEIKIDAPEGPEQLSRYRNALQARASVRLQRPALIYLSPRPPIDPFTLHAQWRDVAAAARRVIPRHEADCSFVHQLFAQFAAHVSAF